MGRGGVLDKYLKKRERDTTAEGEDEDEDDIGGGGGGGAGSGSAKKKARTDSSKVRKVRSARDSELYHMEDTVRPENLLMMVDSSLVDTPERRRFNEQNRVERAQRAEQDSSN